MKTIIVVNVFAACVAVVTPNDFLAFHSYLFYGLQFATLMPYLAIRAKYLKNIFLPTFFILFYFLVNLALGSYLVPREFGWNKQFASDLATGTHYQVIVPFLMLSNLLLFELTRSTLRLVNRHSERLKIDKLNHTKFLNWKDVALAALSLSVFYTANALDIYYAFSIQLAVMIVHLTNQRLQGNWLRYLIYLAYLTLLVATDFDNKREIVMAMFLIVFLESSHRNLPLRFNLGGLAALAGLASTFLILVLTASILRGYGDFQVQSAADAFSLIPAYVGSGVFLDGVIDNLELNYFYGCTIASMDLVLDGQIPLQFGDSLLKVLYLPIPRDLFPHKPESALQIFTQTYAPDWWASDGSLPVMFASDMFINFHVAGLFACGIVWIAVNSAYVQFYRSRHASFEFYSCAFLVTTVLQFARGSGIELYVLYFLAAVPFFALVCFFTSASRPAPQLHRGRQVAQ